jgi:transglutaminase-like putative cysteine protease
VIVSGALLLAATERNLAFPLLAIVLCAGHALIVGPGGPAYITGPVGSLLALGALGYGLLEPRIADVHISYGLAHFLILVQLVKLYGRHEARDLRLIQVATIFEVLVAGIWALDLLYLPLFLVTGLVLMASFAVLSLTPVGAPPRAPCAPEPAGAGSWRGLWSAFWLPAVIVFGVTGLVFMFLPRFRELSIGYQMLPEQVIGFSDNVSLHEVGRLRKSDDIALRAQFFLGGAADAPPIQPPRRLMRGVSLPVYGNGQWFGYNTAMRQVMRSRPPEEVRPGPDFASRDTYLLKDVNATKEMVRQKIVVQSKPITTGFALYRPVSVGGMENYEASPWPLSQDIAFPAPLDPGDSYDVLSLVPYFTAAQLRAAGTPRPGGNWLIFWDIPDEIRPTLEAAAAEVARLYPSETDYDRVMAVQSHLVDSGRFTYTYDLPDLGDQEPVEAFLLTTHSGSCEQFSSAMALILRVWGIPTRLVVGFKDGAYDLTTQTFTFRDRDAHAWVEVFFNDLGWVEFDPTPGGDVVDERPGGVERGITGVLIRLRNVLTVAYRNARARWSSNVIGYNRSQQRRLLQGLTSAAHGLADQAASVFGTLKLGVPYLGLAQVVLLVVVLTSVGLGVYVSAGWALRGLKLQRPRTKAQRTVRFYQELLSILRRKGLSRPPDATPREFARTAAACLAEGSDERPAVVAALYLVTDLFYRVRFGGYELTEAQQGQVRQALATIARARKVRRQGSAPAASRQRG